MSNYVRLCVSFLSGLVLISMCLGCGGMSTTPPGSAANLRVIQGNADAQTVNVVVDGTLMKSNLGYLSNTGYFTVPSGDTMINIQAPPPNGSSLENARINLPANSHTTFVMDGCCPFEHSTTSFADDTTPSPNGNAKLRVVDASLSTTGFDIFVLPSGSTPSGAPTFSAQAFNSASAYLTLAPAAYDVFVTQTPPPGGPIGTVLFHTGAITLSPNQNRTVVILNLCSPGSCDTTGHTLTSLTLADLN